MKTSIYGVFIARLTKRGKQITALLKTVLRVLIIINVISCQHNVC